MTGVFHASWFERLTMRRLYRTGFPGTRRAHLLSLLILRRAHPLSLLILRLSKDEDLHNLPRALPSC